MAHSIFLYKYVIGLIQNASLPATYFVFIQSLRAAQRSNLSSFLLQNTLPKLKWFRIFETMNLGAVISSLLILVASVSYGQVYENRDYYLIDSLCFCDLSESDSSLLVSELKKFHEAKHDTVKLYALNSIVNEMIHDTWGKYAEYLLYYNEELVQQSGNTPQEQRFYDRMYSGSLNDYGIYLSHHGRNMEGIELYKKSLNLALKTQDLRAISSTYNNLGFQYEQLGKVEEALQYHRASLKIDLKLQDTSGITSSYNNLGLLYSNLDEDELAFQQYSKCYEYLKDGHDPWRLGITYGNLGASYTSFNQPDSANYFYEKAREIQMEMGDYLGLSVTLSSMGDNYTDMGETTKAMQFYEEAIETARSVEYAKGLTGALQSYAQLLLKMKRPKEALPLALEAYDIAKYVFDRKITRYRNTLSHLQTVG